MVNGAEVWALDVAEVMDFSRVCSSWREVRRPKIVWDLSQDEMAVLRDLMFWSIVTLSRMSWEEVIV